MKRFLAFMTIPCLLLAGVALAHANLEAAEPAAGSVLSTRPTEISLTFTEPIEVRFSTFKVYPVQLPDDFDRTSENAMLRLNGLAGALVSEVLQKRGDDDARADAGLAMTSRTNEEIVIVLKEDLVPGYYVVMWRALSVDTHTTQNFYIFGWFPEE